jgi:hypothetical protein
MRIDGKCINVESCSIQYGCQILSVNLLNIFNICGVYNSQYTNHNGQIAFNDVTITFINYEWQKIINQIEDNIPLNNFEFLIKTQDLHIFYFVLTMRSNQQKLDQCIVSFLPLRVQHP